MDLVIWDEWMIFVVSGGSQITSHTGCSQKLFKFSELKKNFIEVGLVTQKHFLVAPLVTLIWSNDGRSNAVRHSLGLFINNFQSLEGESSVAVWHFHIKKKKITCMKIIRQRIGL